MMAPTIRTVREKIAWSYANLARAHAALTDGVLTYSRVHHIIRTKLYSGIVSGRMSVRSIYDDERIKLTDDPACSYCGAQSHLAVDHLFPRIRGGPDEADNLILACRSCNSSKQGKDVLYWMAIKGKFPSIFLLRRYLKIVSKYCEREDLMDLEIGAVGSIDFPFDIARLPEHFPPLAELRLRAKVEEVATDPETPSGSNHD